MNLADLSKMRAYSPEYNQALRELKLPDIIKGTREAAGARGMFNSGAALSAEDKAIKDFELELALRTAEAQRIQEKEDLDRAAARDAVKEERRTAIATGGMQTVGTLGGLYLLNGAKTPQVPGMPQIPGTAGITPGTPGMAPAAAAKTPWGLGSLPGSVRGGFGGWTDPAAASDLTGAGGAGRFAGGAGNVAAGAGLAYGGHEAGKWAGRQTFGKKSTRGSGDELGGSAGAGIGYALGGPVGAGAGATAGTFLGSGLNHIARQSGVSKLINKNAFWKKW